MKATCYSPDSIGLVSHWQRNTVKAKYSLALIAVPDPRSKIPPSAWATVLQWVEQGEPLSHIAHDYGVSYEAVRRVPRAALAAQSEEHVSPNLPG
jgi:hypothetical protein